MTHLPPLISSFLFFMLFFHTSLHSAGNPNKVFLGCCKFCLNVIQSEESSLSPSVTLPSSFLASFFLCYLPSSFIVRLVFHSSFPCFRCKNWMAYGEWWIKGSVNQLLFYPLSSRQSSLVALCTCRDFAFLSLLFLSLLCLLACLTQLCWLIPYHMLIAFLR